MNNLDRLIMEEQKYRILAQALERKAAEAWKEANRLVDEIKELDSCELTNSQGE